MKNLLGIVEQGFPNYNSIYYLHKHRFVNRKREE